MCEYVQLSLLESLSVEVLAWSRKDVQQLDSVALRN